MVQTLREWQAPQHGILTLMSIVRNHKTAGIQLLGGASPCQINGAECTEDDCTFHAVAKRCVETIFAKAEETANALDIVDLTKSSDTDARGPIPIRLALELKAIEICNDWKPAPATVKETYTCEGCERSIRQSISSLFGQIKKKVCNANYALIFDETTRNGSYIHMKLRLAVDAPPTELTVQDCVFRDDRDYLIASEMIEAAYLAKKIGIMDWEDRYVDVGISLGTNTLQPSEPEDLQLSENFLIPK